MVVGFSRDPPHQGGLQGTPIRRSWPRGGGARVLGIHHLVCGGDPPISVLGRYNWAYGIIMERFQILF